MLGSGVAGAWAALEAISAAYHGWPIFSAYGASQGAGWVVREVYVGIVLNFYVLYYFCFHREISLPACMH